MEFGPGARLDTGLLRLMLAGDGKLKRPVVLASAVVAARLGELVLAGWLIDDGGRAVVQLTRLPLSLDLQTLTARVAQSPQWTWQTWFWRTGIDANDAYRQAIDHLITSAAWEVSKPRWPRRGVLARDLDPEQVQREADRLDAVARSVHITGRDAVILHLLTVCRAKAWIPLTPPPAEDFIARARDLHDDQRRTLHAIFEALIDIRYQAANSLGRDPSGGTG